MTEARELSLFTAGERLRRGQLTSEALVLSCLERIEVREPEVRAWVALHAEQALQAARGMDQEAARQHWRGPLHGIPLGVKDIFDVKGMETKAGSQAYAGGVADADADSVARLREAGAIFLGKTATTEFAFANPSQARNPWNTAHTPGGSSAGSGAAVADRMCLAALGSQTSGSVLRPAAFNGVVGFKPSYEDISTRGVVPLSWQFDHVGCLTRKVEDAHLLWHLMRHERLLDWQSKRDKLPPSLLPHAPKKIWRVRGSFEGESSPECLVHLERACLLLERNGVKIVEKSLPGSFQSVDEIHQMIMATEAAVYHRDMFATNPQFYSHHLSDLVRTGRSMKATDYIQARRQREIMRKDIAEALADVDAAIMPSAVTTPPELTQNTTGDPRFNRPWSLCGVPSLSLPIGLSSEHLPVGVQLISMEHADEQLLRIGGWCESVFGFNEAPG
ncbi:MAG: amidase [SAR324 cluster bacterium]|nr:amidase [SAR324 cluster bacterium]MCZ6531636.1 amidase [SAR324 cluster bacterium]MCZ6646049.1 amidase [SAR324 cluster bacterium]